MNFTIRRNDGAGRAMLAAALLIAAASRGFCAGEIAALEQRLPSHSLLAASPEALGGALKECVGQNPEHAGLFVRLALGAGRADADAIAPMLVRAALEGLGPQPPQKRISEVVWSAVKTAPTEVLEIVPAAVRSVPRADAEVVVAAAVSAVPDPQKMVTLEGERRVRSGGDGKEPQDGKALAEPARRQLTLAEAIVQVAMTADPGLSADSLTAAVDHALSITSVTPSDPIPTRVFTPEVPIIPPEPPAPPNDTVADFSKPGVTSP